MIGSTVGRYRIDSLLGEGGMGRVYKAFDTSLGRAAAVKVLDPRVVADPERLGRFMREARTASSLNHPNVVTIYEVGELPEGGHFIAMELVEGETLREVLGRGRPDLPRALEWIAQIADGIATAHAAGITHRDLKPENIVIARNGFAKILDFGLAKLHEIAREPDPETKTAVMSTTPGAVLGTVGYMSPEQASGADVDHRSDIFSIGCVLYECVTGRRPFIGDSSIDTLHKIIYSEPPPLEEKAPDAPRELQRIVRKTLAKDQEQRYQSAKDLAIDLRELKSDLSSQPRMSGIRETPPPAATRVQGWPAWIAFAAIAMAAILGVLAVRKRPAAQAVAAAPAQGAMSIERVTMSGNVIGSAISPDGEYIAYAYSDAGKHSLWVRQLASGSALQLVPPAAMGVWGLKFSPDSRSIYYTVKATGSGDRQGTLYQIPILGGQPRRVLTNIESAVTFSPDGAKVAFHRIHAPKAGDSSIVIANADGTGEKTILQKSPPEFLAPVFWGGPEWSSDGKSIASPLRIGGDSKLIAVDVDTAAVRELTTEGLRFPASIASLHDGGGLVVSAAGSRRGTGSQIWFVQGDGKSARQITNDLFDYRAVTVSRDGQTLLAVASDTNTAIWRTTVDATAPAEKLSDGRYDGHGGVAVAPDGSVIYGSFESGKWSIWSLDGSRNKRKLSDSEFGSVGPTVTGDGKTIVFIMFRERDAVLARMNREGGDIRILATVASPSAQLPAITPDDRWVLFGSSADGVKRIWKVSIDGGTPVPVTRSESERASVSPDGRKIAFIAPGAIGVADIDGGNPATIENVSVTASSFVHWTADGKALLHNAGLNERMNIWLHPLDGSPPRKVTRFDDQYVLRFDVAPDGKTLAVTRGVLSRDAVLIRNFR